MANTTADDTRTRPQRTQQKDRREVAFIVRAKTGPGARDWQSIGVAFERKGGAPGFSIKLNTLPIDRNWTGGLVMVPPYILAGMAISSWRVSRSAPPPERKPAAEDAAGLAVFLLSAATTVGLSLLHTPFAPAGFALNGLAPWAERLARGGKPKAEPNAG